MRPLPISKLEAMQAPRETTALDPDVALYRSEKVKHSPARYETSARHPVTSISRMLVDARVRYRNFDDSETWEL